jgi:hypothetical protein
MQHGLIRLVQHVDRVAMLIRGEALQVARRRSVRAVDLVPGGAPIGRLDDHQDIVRLGRLHQEVQVAVRGFPRPDAAGRFHEGAPEQARGDGGRDGWVRVGCDRAALRIRHPKTEGVALVGRDGAVGEAADHERPRPLAMNGGIGRQRAGGISEAHAGANPKRYTRTV